MAWRKTLIMIVILPALFIVLLLLPFSLIVPSTLRPNFYARTCPDVEPILNKVFKEKFKQKPTTIPAFLLLYFHDCFVSGCDASMMIESTKNNTAEKDHPDNLSLSPIAFETIIKAKEVLDAVPKCRDQISCADILTIAVRDAITTLGGPRYEVELGRLDGLSSTAASVDGKLPQPSDGFDKLTAYFAKNGLTIDDMVALSGAHTVGITQCNTVLDRIYNSNKSTEEDSAIDTDYAAQLRKSCHQNNDSNKLIFMDPITPTIFDNSYYKNIQQRKGLFASDQELYSNNRSKSIVDRFARDGKLFHQAFANAMVKLGRTGVKNRFNGNIRRRCEAFN